jgi:hypothetical protein
MGYMHIDNLYKIQEVLMFKRVYAMEKIHGTSAHITFERLNKAGSTKPVVHIKYFSGGAAHSSFSALFRDETLVEDFITKVDQGCSITVYGEAYGGKMQKMSDVYGPNLMFVAFDVKVGDNWLSVPQAKEVCDELGLDFVWYTECDSDVKTLDKYRDQCSQQAIKNGMGEGKESEGIVIRPLIELTKNNGGRIMSKHKGDNFRETAKVRKVVDPAQMEVLKEAQTIADEWVTAMRLEHVVDKLDGVSIDVSCIGKIIPAMIEDVKRESEDEVLWSTAAAKAVGTTTAKLVKTLCQAKLTV